MSNTWELITTLIGSKELLLVVELLSFFCKLFILLACVRFIFKAVSQRLLLFLLITFLFLSLLNDSANIFYTVKQGLLGIKDDIPFFSFFVRFVWGLMVTQYQAIALFMEVLMERRMHFRFRHILHLVFNICVSSIFMYFAFFKYGVRGEALKRYLQSLCSIILFTCMCRFYIFRYFTRFIKEECLLLKRSPGF